MVVKVVDPNQTAKFIYKASYDNIWQQGITLLSRCGFSLDRKDYRLGVLMTQPLPSARPPDTTRAAVCRSGRSL